MRTRLTLFLLVVFAFAADAARSEDALPEGARVRVNLAGGRHVTGTLISLHEGTLVMQPLAPPGKPREFKLAKIESLQVPGGRRSRGKGALKGAAIGAVAGAASGFLCAAGPSGGFADPGLAGCVAGSAVLGAILGSSIGALRTQPEGWKKVSLEEFRVSLGPARGRGVVASLSWSFR